MAYAKLFSSITESSLWSESKEARLLFVSMLARCDATGFVEAALPGLARLANLTTQETTDAVAVLESPDVHSKNPDNQGRRITRVPGGWMIINYESYRERRSDEERREYMRKYMQDYRRKGSVNTNANNVNHSVYDVSEKVNGKPSVSHGKPPLAQAEAEAEAEAEAPKNKTGRFTPPVIEEVKLQADKTGLPEHEATKFFLYYESKGWMVGKSKMKSWPHALSGWKVRWEETRGSQTSRQQQPPQPKPPEDKATRHLGALG